MSTFITYSFSASVLQHQAVIGAVPRERNCSCSVLLELKSARLVEPTHYRLLYNRAPEDKTSLEPRVVGHTGTIKSPDPALLVANL